MFAGAIGGIVGAALTLLIVSLTGQGPTLRSARWPLLGIASTLPIAGLLISMLQANSAPTLASDLVIQAPPSLARMTNASPSAEQSLPSKVPPVASFVDKLEAKLRDHPGDANGWLLLARSYEHVRRPDDARNAYRQAVVLGAEDSVLAERLRGRAGDAASATSDQAAAVQDTAGADVRGTVKLDPSAASQVTPDDTVFIFAKANEGQPMPLAVLKVTAGQLPLDFVLNDGLAMTANLKLSSFEDVVVTAKVSKSGDAAAAGLSAPSRIVHVGDSSPVELVIGGT
jgi:hypothetical protein